MSTDTDPTPTTRHAEQSIPAMWRAFELGEETIVVHNEEGTEVYAYRVDGTTRDVLRIRFADAALYEGSVVRPFWDEDLCTVRLCHSYAGEMGSHRIPEWLDEPVILLEKLDRGDVTEAIDA